MYKKGFRKLMRTMELIPKMAVFCNMEAGNLVMREMLRGPVVDCIAQSHWALIQFLFAFLYFFYMALEVICGRIPPLPLDCFDDGALGKCSTSGLHRSGGNFADIILD